MKRYRTFVYEYDLYNQLIEKREIGAFLSYRDATEYLLGMEGLKVWADDWTILGGWDLFFGLEIENRRINGYIKEMEIIK